MSVDAGTVLWRALARSAPPADLVRSDSRRWASATFAGERHRLCFTAVDDGHLARWLAEAPELEVSLRGHLLADLIVAGVTRADGRATVTLEALTLEQD